MNYIALARSRRADEKRRQRRGFRLKVITGTYLGSLLLFTFLFLFVI